MEKLKRFRRKEANRSFLLESKLAAQLSVDASVAHNGICLTVEEVNGNQYKVTTIEETLRKTNAGQWEKGDLINLEPSMQLNDQLDGHLVQGHVDGTGVCIKKEDKRRKYGIHFSIRSLFRLSFN